MNVFRNIYLFSVVTSIYFQNAYAKEEDITGFTVSSHQIANRMPNALYLPYKVLQLDQQRKEEKTILRARRDVPVTDLLDTCSITHNCEFNRNLFSPSCYCDSQCTYFMDCCYYFNQNSPSEIMPQITVYRHNLECRLDILPDLAASIRGYWMVTTCSNAFSEDLSVRCNATTKNDIPVTDENGTVYGNAFCARCHGQKRYTPWTVNIKYDIYCRDYFSSQNPFYEVFTPKGMEKLRENSCTYYVPPAETRPRVCYPSLRVADAKSNDSICRNHTNIVMVDYKYFYRNIFCVNNWHNYLCVKEWYPYTSRSLRQPLNILFTMRQPLADDSMICDANYRMDYKTGLCFPVTTTCKSKTAQCSYSSGVLYENYRITINAQFISNKLLDENFVKRVAVLFQYSLPREAFKFYPLRMSILLYRSKLAFQSNSSQIATVFNFTDRYIVQRPLTVVEILNLESTLRNMEWTYKEVHPGFETIYLRRALGLPVIDKDAFNRSDITPVAKTSDSLILHGLENTSSSAEIPDRCNVTAISTEYTTQNDQSNLFDVYFDCRVSLSNISEVEFNRNTILPKDNNIRNASISNHILYFQAVLTYTTLTLSSVSIPPTLFIHRYLRLSFMTQIHISENLLMVLFFFNIIFMLGIGRTADPHICMFVAVSVHYFSLSFFAWLFIYVVLSIIGIRRMKKPQKIRSNRHLKKLFPKRFYIIGYATPLLVIIPSFVIQICQCTSITIGYTDIVCFPTAYPANLFTFIGPVLTTILLSFICLSYGAWYISKLTRFSAALNVSRSYIGVYLRICLVSGFSWVLGFLSELADNDILRYMFIILADLHGFIICMCMISTDLFRNAFAKHHFSSSQPEKVEMTAPRACTKHNHPDMSEISVLPEHNQPDINEISVHPEHNQPDMNESSIHPEHNQPDMNEISVHPEHNQPDMNEISVHPEHNQPDMNEISVHPKHNQPDMNEISVHPEHNQPDMNESSVHPEHNQPDKNEITVHPEHNQPDMNESSVHPEHNQPDINEISVHPEHNQPVMNEISVHPEHNQPDMNEMSIHSKHNQPNMNEFSVHPEHNQPDMNESSVHPEHNQHMNESSVHPLCYESTVGVLCDSPQFEQADMSTDIPSQTPEQIEMKVFATSAQLEQIEVMSHASTEPPIITK